MEKIVFLRGEGTRKISIKMAEILKETMGFWTKGGPKWCTEFFRFLDEVTAA